MIWAWMETSRAETGSSHDDELGIQGQGPGDADPLALPAGELVRVAVALFRSQADFFQQVRRPVPALSLPL